MARHYQPYSNPTFKSGRVRLFLFPSPKFVAVLSPKTRLTAKLFPFVSVCLQRAFLLRKGKSLGLQGCCFAVRRFMPRKAVDSRKERGRLFAKGQTKTHQLPLLVGYYGWPCICLLLRSAVSAVNSTVE